jgi:hypothetical protein
MQKVSFKNKQSAKFDGKINSRELRRFTQKAIRENLLS